ncbi:hypothetical protein KSS87_003953 [Heliosperma pusillum]|nr:hypothetical protein KSS87_003953 [Heliosperma pusillum]
MIYALYVNYKISRTTNVNKIIFIFSKIKYTKRIRKFYLYLVKHNI